MATRVIVPDGMGEALDKMMESRGVYGVSYPNGNSGYEPDDLAVQVGYEFADKHGLREDSRHSGSPECSARIVFSCLDPR